jgi:hypothetical protein
MAEELRGSLATFILLLHSAFCIGQLTDMEYGAQSLRATGPT